MTAPYLAPSLAVLRAEINARWPHRDHTSDGWIGDTRHQATQSDHNPNSRGSVDAIDVDEDGVDFPVVFAAIKRHPSARYVIYERTLYHRLRGWKPEPYDGVNPHDHHFHVSIDQTATAEQDRRPWGLLEDDMTTPAQFVEILRDPTVAAMLRAMPWQYAGGGIPAGMSTLGVLNELVTRARAGADQVDEQELAAALLVTLTPAAIAAALPAEVARQVADELAARLAS